MLDALAQWNLRVPIVGWGSRARTCDILVNSQTLYQLSYTPSFFGGDDWI